MSAVCIQCGKPCSRQISFNWYNGVRYLCSKECERESRTWRLKLGKNEGVSE